MAKVELQINGVGYSGWQSVTVQRGMEQLSSTFDLTLADQWPGQSQPRPIAAGQRCVLKIDGETVINGYVDDVDLQLDAGGHSITVRGRDQTGDLVDCSVLVSKGRPGQWRNRTLLQIALDVCQPFGIAVRTEVELAPIRTANVQEAESGYELLDRLAKQAGVLLLTDGSGALVIAAPGTQKVGLTLREGVNLLSASVSSSWRDRFSLYVLKGQRPGSDEDSAAGSAHVTAQQTDPALSEAGRYRPLVIVADEHGGKPQQHVAWEAHVRAGRSTRAHVSVVGWSHGAGLWTPNTLVRLVAPTLQTDAELMIVSVTYSLSSSQFLHTELELADPAAFDVEKGLRASPIGEKARGKDGLIRAIKGDKGTGRKATETEAP